MIMSIALESLCPLVALALFALVAARFGRDSRDGVETPAQRPLGSFDAGTHSPARRASG
jgi:hypothetical protein